MFSLLEEERCGHLVSEDTKKLWAVEISCLEELKRICEKYNIKYYAGGGTLLGAVRHKGYIPWDDDIDIFMFEEDYEHFCKIAASELKEPFFLQHFTTQKLGNPGMARIRRNDTTGCTKYEYKNFAFSPEYNCGVFIDIFPLHYIPNSKVQISFQKFLKHIYISATIGYASKEKLICSGKLTFKKRFNKNIILWEVLSLFLNIESISKKYINACSKCKLSNNVGLVSFGGFKKYVWPAEYWEEVVILPFEDTEINCPKEYDKILRKQYGDYNIFQKGTAVHTFEILDVNTPYSEKLNEYYNKFNFKK